MVDFNRTEKSKTVMEEIAGIARNNKNIFLSEVDAISEDNWEVVWILKWPKNKIRTNNKEPLEWDTRPSDNFSPIVVDSTTGKIVESRFRFPPVRKEAEKTVNRYIQKQMPKETNVIYNSYIREAESGQMIPHIIPKNEDQFEPPKFASEMEKMHKMYIQRFTQ